MTPLDWLIVIVANGAILVYGRYLAPRTKTSYDWFLAAKGLPWWTVGARGGGIVVIATPT